MKQKFLPLLAAVLLLGACGNNEKKDGKDAGAGDTATAKPTAGMPDTTGGAQRWMEYMTPGEKHKWLAKYAGNWEGEVHSYMPGGPVDTQQAKETIRMTMNGLYQESDFSSNMMGQPMSGHSTMGFDNMRKVFVSTWIDNFGSGIIMMEGSYDEASKTLNMKGKQSDPMVNMQSDIRQEMKFADDDNYTMTMYATGPDGKEMKMMDGVFKRKK